MVSERSLALATYSILSTRHSSSDQLCKLKFGSWTYDAAQVNLTKRRDNVDMTNYIRSGEWHIVRIAIQRNDVTYPCCPGIYYPDVTIYGKRQREIFVHRSWNLLHSVNHL